ncbi:MAG: AAA family ATPase, partial [Sedimenticola sp.]
MVGPKGSGKTTLFERDSCPPPDTWHSCRLNANSIENPEYLLKALRLEFIPNSELSDYEHAIRDLLTFWESMRQQGRVPTLMIDDAHLLSPEILKVLLGFHNLNSIGSDAKLLCIVLFSEQLLKDRFTESGTISADISSLSEVRLAPFLVGQTSEYLTYWLRSSNHDGAASFSEREIQKIHQQSGGWPCDIGDLAERLLVNKSRWGWLPQWFRERSIYTSIFFSCVLALSAGAVFWWVLEQPIDLQPDTTEGDRGDLVPQVGAELTQQATPPSGEVLNIHPDTPPKVALLGNESFLEREMLSDTVVDNGSEAPITIPTSMLADVEKKEVMEPLIKERLGQFSSPPTIPVSGQNDILLERERPDHQVAKATQGQLDILTERSPVIGVEIPVTKPAATVLEVDQKETVAPAIKGKVDQFLPLSAAIVLGVNNTPLAAEQPENQEVSDIPGQQENLIERSLPVVDVHEKQGELVLQDVPAGSVNRDPPQLTPTVPQDKSVALDISRQA